MFFIVKYVSLIFTSLIFLFFHFSTFSLGRSALVWLQGSWFESSILLSTSTHVSQGCRLTKLLG